MNPLGKLTATLLGTLAVAAADEVQLRDKSAVTGRILAEKSEQVFVDLGYTVIGVPRSEIVRIIRAGETPAAPKSSNGKKPATSGGAANVSTSSGRERKGLYQVNTTPPQERTVRELVAQLGEAVVQVRTPGGLGSGFLLNDEGHLITNFHVIEGETQISIEVYHQRAGQLERRAYKQVRIVAMNKFADLALLKIEDKDAPKFASVALGEADVLSVGERVFAIGCQRSVKTSQGGSNENQPL